MKFRILFSALLFLALALGVQAQTRVIVDGLDYGTNAVSQGGKYQQRLGIALNTNGAVKVEGDFSGVSVNTATNVAVGTVVAVPDGTGTNMLMFSSNPGGANNSGPAAVVVMVYDPVTGKLNKWQGTSSSSGGTNIQSTIIGTNGVRVNVDASGNVPVTLSGSNSVTLVNTVAIAGNVGVTNATDTNIFVINSASSPIPIVGLTTVCRGSITNDLTAPYSVGDVYIALFTCTNAARVNGGTVTWQSFKLFMGDLTNFNFEAFLFNAVPASYTQMNTAWVVSNADMQNSCVGYFNSTDYKWSALGTTNYIFTANNLAQPSVCATGSRDLYLAIKVNSVVPAGTNTTGVRLVFWQD